MKQYEEIIGEARRMEYDDETGKLFLVFEIINENIKQRIKNSWTEELELRLVIGEKEKE